MEKGVPGLVWTFLGIVRKDLVLLNETQEAAANASIIYS